MKIIDKKKDYYDYLSGVNGIDSKVVFDRRGSIILAQNDYFSCYLARDVKQPIYPQIPPKHHPMLIKSRYLGNYLHGWDPKDNVYFGDLTVARINIGSKQYFFLIDRWNENGMIRGREFLVGETYRPKNEPITGIDYIASDRLRRYALSYNSITNVIFDGTWIPKYIDANTAWENIYAYVSSHNDKDIIDNRTDGEKILSNGFDKVTSFRKM